MAVVIGQMDSGVRLRPAWRWRKLLLTVHVLTTVGLFGADLVLLTLGITSVLGAEPRTVYPAAAAVGKTLLGPLAVASLATGLLLGALSQWGLLKYWWVVIKLAITVALTPVVLFVLVPRLEAAAEAGRLLTESERAQLVIAPGVASSLLALNATLAVFKPHWRLRRSTG